MDWAGIAWVFITIGLLGTAAILVFDRCRASKPAKPEETTEPEAPEIFDEFGRPLEDSPLKRAIQQSYLTGQPVFWNEGDSPPPPGSRIRARRGNGREDDSR